MSGKKKTGLGRGLSALMDDSLMTEVPVNRPEDKIETKSAKSAAESGSANGLRTVGIDRLERNPAQPRKHFSKSDLDDLIASVQQKGVLQPVLVRPLGNNRYQIVAGERRWTAALKAGLSSIPVMVRDLSDLEVLEIGVIENVQRADLNPLEEAEAYDRLIREFGRSQQDIAQSIGKSRAHIANTLRLVNLPRKAQEMLADGRITAGHARAILASSRPEILAYVIEDRKLSVREAEAYVRSEKRGDDPAAKKHRRAGKEKLPDIIKLEKRITDQVGLKADIRHKGDSGEIRFKYGSLEQLEALLKKLD